MDSELKEILKGIKGFRDFYPEDYAEIKKILDIMHVISRKFGYEEYEGPSVEFAKLIEHKSGQALVDETYRLFDRENRKLVLRPEQTPTLARLIANQHQRYPKPMRWYTIPRIFRDETPQRGRVKEHFQYNADIIGVDHVAADAEIIALTTNIIRTAGLKEDEFICTINSREFVQGFLDHLKIDNQVEVIRVIDSREKYLQNYIKNELTQQGVKKDKADDLSLIFRTIWMQDPELKNVGKKLLDDSTTAPIAKKLDEIAETVIKKALLSVGLTEFQADQIYKFASIKDTPKEFIERIRSEIDLGEKALEALQKMSELADYLEIFNVIHNCVYDASIARGLEYYTGIVYEFFDRTGSVVRTIAGGGRYDQLVDSFGGGLIPCTGIGMGETVLLSILQQLGRTGEYTHPAKVYVAPISKDVYNETAEIVNMLRDEFEIIFNPFGWNLKKQLQDASTRNIPLMVIVGKRDLDEKKVTLQDLDTEEKKTVEISKLISEIKKKIN